MHPVPVAAVGAALGILIFSALSSHETKPPTPAAQWQGVYRTCMEDSSNSASEKRAACIAAAHRVLACTEQKEEK